MNSKFAINQKSRHEFFVFFFLFPFFFLKDGRTVASVLHDFVFWDLIGKVVKQVT